MFYQMPLSNISTIISLVDFSTINNPFVILSLLLGKIHKRYHHGTTILLESINYKHFSIKEWVRLLALFELSSICVSLSKLYLDDQKMVGVDYDFILSEKR